METDSALLRVLCMYMSTFAKQNCPFEHKNEHKILDKQQAKISVQIKASVLHICMCIDVQVCVLHVL